MDEKPFWRAADSEYDWFNEVYLAAGDTVEEIPWAKGKPNLFLTQWLAGNNVSGRSRTALVVGCGLGDDAEALSGAGYTVTAFDISERAIQWCHERFPESDVNYLVADLFNLPPEVDSGYDLVFEASTLQALPRHLLNPAMETIAQRVGTGGELFVAAFGRRPGTPLPDEPPWPLLKSELDRFQDFGLTLVEEKEVFVDRGGRPGPRWQLIYR